MKEPIIVYLRRRLNEFKGMWPTIQRDIDGEYNTMAKIAQGVRTNPTLDTVQPLLDWFEARDKVPKPAKRGKRTRPGNGR